MAKSVKTYFLIVLGAVLYAVSTVFFIFPHDLLLGGTSGISVILARWLPFSPGTVSTAINLLLIVVAFLVLGKGMAVRTFVGSLLTTVFITLVEQLFPLAAPPVGSFFLSAVIGAAIIAVASGFLFYADSSSGGTDILALIVQKFTPLPIGGALLLTDFIIVLLGGILLGWQLALASFIGFLIKVLGIDAVILIIRKTSIKKAQTH